MSPTSFRRAAAPTRAIVSVRWGNPFTMPPADAETLADGRTLWACSILDRAHERTIVAEAAPAVRPGAGWAHGWTVILPPPVRWSGERKAATRRRNLRARLERNAPLFADQLEAEELARRPRYFDPAAIDAGQDMRRSLT